MVASAVVGLVVWLVAEVGVTFSRSAPRDAAEIQRFPRSARTIARTNRKQISKRQKLFASVATSPALNSRPAPLNREFPINLPVLSSPPVVPKYQFTGPAASGSPIDSRSSGEVNAESLSTGPICDESLPPHTPSRRASKIGTVAARAIIFGVALVGLRIRDHEH